MFRFPGKLEFFAQCSKKTQGINGQFGLNYIIKSSISSNQHPRSKMNEKVFQEIVAKEIS